ncbi:MAG: hypothetical protein NTZ56_11975 [Acidobacteria bacterium]|nr:hypothetical protein [Acidobacteriota bacterium]
MTAIAFRAGPEAAGEMPICIAHLVLGERKVSRADVGDKIRAIWTVGRIVNRVSERFNLKDDPAEQRNLYAAQPAMVARLTALLARYQADGRSRPA